MKKLRVTIITGFWAIVILCVIGLCLSFLVMINNYMQTYAAVSIIDIHDSCTPINSDSHELASCIQQE